MTKISEKNLHQHNSDTKASATERLERKITGLEDIFKNRVARPLGDLHSCKSLVKLLEYSDQELHDISSMRDTLYQEHNHHLKQRFDLLSKKIKQAQVSFGDIHDDSSIQKIVADRTKAISEKMSLLAENVFQYRDERDGLRESLHAAEKLINTQNNEIKKLRRQLAKVSNTGNVLMLDPGSTNV